MNVRLKIVKELAKFEERTSFYIKDYWGSEIQIKSEVEIMCQKLLVNLITVQFKITKL